MWKLSSVFLLAALSGASEVSSYWGRPASTRLTVRDPRFRPNSTSLTSAYPYVRSQTNPHLRSSIAVSSNEPALRVESVASAVTSDSDVARSLESRLEALETEQRARFEALESKHAQDLEALETELETLGTKHAKDLETLKTELETLKAEHAVLQRCIEVEEVYGDDITKLHVKSECELNVHGGHTTHGHHSIKGGNLFVSNGLGSSKCSSSSSSVDEDVGDGDGATVKCSGTGNIIVGHQQDDLSAGHKAITGSHNVILGEGHTVTSHGGIVSGVGHVASGAHASAIAGSGHTVSGAGAIALGGNHGTARGSNSVVSGGYQNFASGSYSSVSGGMHNTASGPNSSVSGG
ncbi:hypothetical protein THAOC_28232, partial [Thalassiosira oceanica]